MRKLASVRKILDIKDIENADNIQAYKVDGWWVVGKKGEFKVGDSVVYFEIDSWIPNELAPFLSKGKEPKEYKGIKGERLRTIKLKGQISQGLIMPNTYNAEVGEDLTEQLGIIKWEPILNTQGNIKPKGNFPSFIPKTDEERVQNLVNILPTYKEKYKNWNITEKLDGTSMTVYHNEGVVGICSRNLELKIEESNKYTDTVSELNLLEKLLKLNANIAIQGELIGPSIQANKYKLSKPEYRVYKIWDISNQCYIRWNLVEELCELLNIPTVSKLSIDYNFLDLDIDKMLEFAEDKSLLNITTEREGIVVQSIDDPNISFKVISNKFLLGEK